MSHNICSNKKLKTYQKESQDYHAGTQSSSDIRPTKPFPSFKSEIDCPFEYSDEVIDNETREEKAVLSFFKKFTDKYGDDHVDFQYCCFRQVIDFSYLSPEDERNAVALYLHNENSKFSQMICKEFADDNSSIRKVLENSFNLLGWDVETDTDGALELALDKWPDLDIIKQRIKEKRSALFVLCFNEDNVSIFSGFYRDDLSVDIITTALNAAAQARFPCQNEQEDLSPVGPREFHNMMCNGLGNRDYDQYEADEHELLKEKIAFAKFGAPPTELGYTKTQNKDIEETYNAIIAQSSKHSESKDCVQMIFVFNCAKPLPDQVKKRRKKNKNYSEYTDFIPFPVYVIRKCFDSKSNNPCRIIVDHDNRVYTSWSDYIENNKLHKCIMVYPENGLYRKTNGEVSLISNYSPACGIGNAVLKGTDIASAVIGISTLGVYGVAAIPAAAVIAPVAIPVAAVTGAAVGLYSLIRSSMTIHDRRIHEQDMSLRSSEARGAYIGIVATSLGFVGMGANVAVSQLASRGVKIGESAKIALNSVNVINVGTSAVHVGNATYDIVDQCMDNKSVSALSIMQLSSAILFFRNTVFNFKTANVIIEESQASTLSNYENSLSSNRQRKTFNKLLKETIRQNNGNVQKGKAEVISSISKMPNRDETFAFFTRNNKRFNKYGVKFAAQGGKITLNGMAFDAFSNQLPSDVTTFISSLPPVPKPTFEETGINIMEIKAFFSELIFPSTLTVEVEQLKCVEFYQESNSTEEFIAKSLSIFEPFIRRKIIRILGEFMKKIEKTEIEWRDLCKEAYPELDVWVVSCQKVVEFICMLANNLKTTFVRKYGNAKKYDRAQKSLYWLNKIMTMFVKGKSVPKFLLDECINWVVCEVIKIVNNSIKQKKRISSALTKTSCTVCGGFFMC